jgi:dienelactone hydrolase
MKPLSQSPVKPEILPDSQSFRPSSRPPLDVWDVMISCGEVMLTVAVTLPLTARGLVLFVHGHHSSRHSFRMRWIAGELNRAGLATLLFDLHTPEESGTKEPGMPAGEELADRERRTLGVVEWTRRHPRLSRLPLGLVGLGSGAAVAINVAARLSECAGLVSCGGWTQLVDGGLRALEAPTMFIVGKNDDRVARWNRRSFDQLRGPKALRVIPGASHLFVEPGSLEQVGMAASGWFEQCFADGLDHPSRTSAPVTAGRPASGSQPLPAGRRGLIT